ncbi:hypothetical protein, partial [Paraburkholderia caribensis]|uniref:hypothetical protein n=1 Tax=Paraburkholderia caribensis TaxID=75105 RepID=UPI001CC77EA1
MLLLLFFCPAGCFARFLLFESRSFFKVGFCFLVWLRRWAGYLGLALASFCFAFAFAFAGIRDSLAL